MKYQYVKLHQVPRCELSISPKGRKEGGDFSANLLELRFCQLNTVVFRFIRKTNEEAITYVSPRGINDWHFAVPLKRWSLMSIPGGGGGLTINMESINSQHFTVHMDDQSPIIDPGAPLSPLKYGDGTSSTIVSKVVPREGNLNLDNVISCHEQTQITPQSRNKVFTGTVHYV